MNPEEKENLVLLLAHTAAILRAASHGPAPLSSYTVGVLVDNAFALVRAARARVARAIEEGEV